MDNLEKNRAVTEAFVKVCQALNQLGITPILYGSLSLVLQFDFDLEADDIDLAISAKEFLSHWAMITAALAPLGYQVDPEHVHEFIGHKPFVGFEIWEDLTGWALIEGHEMIESQLGKAAFRQLPDKVLLQIYQTGLRDPYRVARKGKNDNTVIAQLSMQINITKSESANRLSQRITQNLKPGVKPLLDINKFYQSNRDQ